MYYTNDKIYLENLETMKDIPFKIQELKLMSFIIYYFLSMILEENSLRKFLENIVRNL